MPRRRGANARHRVVRRVAATDDVTVVVIIESRFELHVFFGVETMLVVALFVVLKENQKHILVGPLKY